MPIYDGRLMPSLRWKDVTRVLVSFFFSFDVWFIVGGGLSKIAKPLFFVLSLSSGGKGIGSKAYPLSPRPGGRDLLLTFLNDAGRLREVLFHFFFVPCLIRLSFFLPTFSPRSVRQASFPPDEVRKCPFPNSGGLKSLFPFFFSPPTLRGQILVFLLTTTAAFGIALMTSFFPPFFRKKEVCAPVLFFHVVKILSLVHSVRNALDVFSALSSPETPFSRI